MDWRKPVMQRDKEEHGWQQRWAGNCIPSRSLGEEKAPICSVCQYPWCKYSHVANLKLPTGYHQTQIWGSVCTMDSH